MRFLLSFKRVAKKGSVIVMLFVLAACILLCGMLSEDDGIPACGVVSGSDEVARDITDALYRDGLVRYESAEDLCDAIRRGEMASGMVFSEELSTLMHSTDLDGAVTFYESERIMCSPIYKYRATAYILEHYTPYLSSKLLAREGAELSPEEAKSGIDAYLAGEDTFNFTFENAEGAPLAGEHYSVNLTMGTLSLFLFFAFGLFAVPYTEKQFLPLAKRVGLRKALTSFSMCSAASTVILFFAVTAAALAISDKIFANGASALTLPAAVYILFLSALGIAVTAIFGSTEKVRVPIIAVCLLSVAVCPIFIDIAEFLGIPAWVRHMVPTYFFYTARENTVVCAVIAAVMFAAAWGLYYVCYKKKLVV